MTPTALDRIELGAWIEAYGRAWETGDDALTASLFKEHANYRSGPFCEPFRAHDEIRAYARRTAATQRDSTSGWAAPSSTAAASRLSGGRR